MEIVILGGAGAIGSNLARYFNDRDHRVIVFDNLTRYGVHNNLPPFRRRGIEFIHGDIRNTEDFLRIPCAYKGAIRAVINCAAQPTAVDGYRYPRFDYTNNTHGVFNSLEYVRHNADCLVFFSTNKVYSADVVNAPMRIVQGDRQVWATSGTPSLEGFNQHYGFSEQLTLSGGEKCIYGATKAASDILVREYCDAFKIPHVANRYSCLAGPWQWGKPEQGWAAWWVIAAELGLPIEYIGHEGRQVRDVLFTDDVCRLIDAQINTILHDRHTWGAYTIGGSHKHTLSLREATALVEKMTGKKMQVSYTSEPRVADHIVYISDIRKAVSTFGWEPTLDIHTGYQQIYKWVMDNIDVLKGIYK